MNGTFESCMSCTLLLVTFALTLYQGQGCDLTARPHPRGICGEDLSQAHANLCFLLRRKHPGIFDKRSSVPSSPSSSSSSSSSSELMPSSYFSQPDHRDVTGQGHSRVRRESDFLERVYSIPLAVLAKIRLTEDNWRSFVYKRGGVESRIVPGEKSDEFPYSLEDLHELPDSPTRTLIRMLSKRRSPVQKRSIGLVCECCMNYCRPRQIAMYC